jgi:hypothetical protein
LLELLQCSLLTHFGDGGRDGGVAGVSLMVLEALT